MAIKSMFESGEPIPLRALKSQVGGHFMILEIDSDWVCKPVLARELLFYENVPEKLKKFTPKYNGVISVGATHRNNGEYQFMAYPPGKRNLTTAMNNREHLITVQLDNESHLKCSLSRMDPESKGSVKTMASTDIDRGITSPLADFRIQELDESKRHDYIILENLTGKFKRPCIVDLKLGTRTYSDDMSGKRKQAHLEKSEATTSKSLGVRLGGMQLYHSSEEKYYFMSKYFGHTLKRDAFFEVLIDFLYNGDRYRLELLPQLIEKLKELREVIRHLDSYRLFSSSLLIMYEGEDPLGMDSGRPVIQNGCHSISEVVSHDHLRQPKETLKQTEHRLDSHKTSSLNSDHGILDVRMIDFQNTSGEFGMKYDGPDEGCLLGLTNIINAYEAFMNSKSPAKLQ